MCINIHIGLRGGNSRIFCAHPYRILSCCVSSGEISREGGFALKPVDRKQVLCCVLGEGSFAGVSCMVCRGLVRKECA